MGWKPKVLATLLFVAASFLAVPGASQLHLPYHVNVTPTCEQQAIKVVLAFDADDWPDGRFEDWIIVGTNNRAECRLRGNGELRYVIELTVFSDPCQTQMPSAGVFQNRIRIGKNPAVILHGDKTFIIKCIYGLPEINQLDIPTINPSFNAVTLADLSTSTIPDELSPAVVPASDETVGEVAENQDVGDSDDSGSISWTVLLSVIGGLFFFVLTLMFIFVCFRWRMEGREKASVTQNGGAVGKFSISDLWWSNKNGAINAEQLPSVQTSNERSSSTAVRSTVQMSSSVSSRGSSTGSERILRSDPSSNNSQHHSATTDSATNAANDETPQSYSEWRSRILANMSNKHLNNNTSVNLDRCSSMRTEDGAVGENQLSEVRSITEIYRSAEMTVGEGDTLSQSTLEGVSFTPNHHHCPNPAAEALVRSVGKIRGIGPRKLTEQEFGRWRRLVTCSASFREALSRTRGSKQIEQVCSEPYYKKLFTKEKWNAIIRCIGEYQQQQQHGVTTKHYTKRNDLQRQDLVASSLNVYVGDVGSSGW